MHYWFQTICQTQGTLLSPSLFIPWSIKVLSWMECNFVQIIIVWKKQVYADKSKIQILSSDLAPLLTQHVHVNAKRYLDLSISKIELMILPLQSYLKFSLFSILLTHLMVPHPRQKLRKSSQVFFFINISPLRINEQVLSDLPVK